MVNNRRSEFEIIGELLDLSRTGAKKTELLYQANLSYTLLTNYLNFLIDKEILIINEVKNNGSSYKYYLTTKKGEKLLSDISKTLSHLR